MAQKLLLNERPHSFFFHSIRERGLIHLTTTRSTHMQWTTPAFTDLRFGFEITMYIANR